MGVFLIILSAAVYYYKYKSKWSIDITGLHSLTHEEINSYVQYYLKENSENISSNEIKSILEFHPRIKSAEVSIRLKRINISIVEKTTGYLEHNNQYVGEISSNGQVLQEMIFQKNHLSEDLPIFYLTVENDNEISTIKRDIIRLWDATKISHAFIWKRLSEIVLKRDEMDNPEIDFFHSYLPVKITMYNKFDSYAFRKLWAVMYLLESENYSKNASVRIYQDHGVLE
jgi:hypothetical protein